MHVAFSRLLKQRKIPHLNIIIKPSKEDMKRRKIADKGIKIIENEIGKPKVYDNQKMIDKHKETVREKEKVIQRINLKIAREVEVYSTQLSNAAELLKYQLSA